MSRVGSVLIIVVGLAMLILSLSLSYVMVVRSDIDEVRALSRDVQARAMLNAALCYIAEGSRIGWSTVHHQDWSTLPNGYASETLGWNDIRNGAVGPIPYRVWTASGAEDAPQEVGGGDSPHRIGRATGRWPDLGSTVRQSLYAWQRPPYAIQLEHNPIRLHASQADLPPQGGWYRQGSSIYGVNTPFTAANGQVTDHNSLHNWSTGDKYNGQAWRFASQPRPDPAPVAATLAEFNAGDSRPRAGSNRAAWFRVYRELPSDHDGNGVPWYDTVNLNGDSATPPNGSVFIITCGAGGTQGFRDWNEVVADLGSTGASEVFYDEATFWDIRRDETLLWYRAEWTAYTQQNLAPWGALSVFRGPGIKPAGVINTPAGAQPIDPLGQRGPINRQSMIMNAWSAGRQFWRMGANTSMRPVTWPSPLPFGSFRWVAALEREPPTW